MPAEWSSRLHCDHCDRVVLCRVAGYEAGQRIWCPDCAPDCLEAAGYRRWEHADLIMQDGALFVLDAVADVVPDPNVVADLQHIEARRYSKVRYTRLERLIERGLVTATGARLTKRGHSWLNS